MSDMLCADQIVERLTDRQRVIVGDCLGADDDFGYWHFGQISKRLGIDRDQARADVHALRNLGLVTFGKGLATDDGEFFGSGYALNARGLEVRDIISRNASPSRASE